MLSRIAESFFWLGRYVERAEDTARLLDVTYRMSLLPYRITDNAQAWAEPWALPLVINGLAPHLQARRITGVTLRRPDLRWPSISICQKRSSTRPLPAVRPSSAT